MIFALAGNQNCGKTTLFNQLTGSNQHVGNFPGVTVDQKMGEVRGEKNCSVVDLPGIYSIRPYTAEEIVTRDFILNEKPDGIINIVDATNIERNCNKSICPPTSVPSIPFIKLTVPELTSAHMVPGYGFITTKPNGWKTIIPKTPPSYPTTFSASCLAINQKS